MWYPLDVRPRPLSLEDRPGRRELGDQRLNDEGVALRERYISIVLRLMSNHHGCVALSLMVENVHIMGLSATAHHDDNQAKHLNHGKAESKDVHLGTSPGVGGL